MGFDRGRIVQIWAPQNVGGGGRVALHGSGYRVGPKMVLTAAHVVTGHPVRDPLPGPPGFPDPAGVRLAVLASGSWVPAVVVWRDDEADVAVLLAESLPDLPAGSPAPRWGRITGTDPVPCLAVGFPWAVPGPDGTRDTEHLHGFITPLSGMVRGAQVITVVSSAPRERTEGGSPWAGMSGAAVFAGRYLVGVVAIDPARYGTDRVHAVSMSGLLQDDPDLAALLGIGDMREIEPVHLPSRLAITAQDSIGLRPPYRSLSGPDPSRAPARLLLAKHGVVPFSGRNEQLVDLQQWCRQEHSFALRVVTGEGGSGKTRLAGQLCLLMAAEGWDTGFADFDQPGGDTTLDYDRPTLVVIDEAGQHGNLVAKLLNGFAFRPPGAVPVRLLLIARHIRVWWTQLNRETEQLADTYADPPLQLTDGGLDLDERARQYRSAADAFGQFRTRTSAASIMDQPPGGIVGRGTVPVPNLSDEAFANPLMVHMTAFLDAFPDPQVDPSFEPSERKPAGRDSSKEIQGVRNQTLQGVLLREQWRWRMTPGSPVDTSGEPDEHTADQAVALVTLTAPLTEQATVDRLVAVPRLSDASGPQRRTTAAWLYRLYPGPEPPWIVPLRPDLVAEELLATTDRLTDLADSALALLLDAQDNAAVSQLLRGLVRASHRHTVHTSLDRVLSAHLPALLDRALADQTAPLPAVLDRALQAAPQPGLAANLVDRLPPRSIILAPLALTLAKQSVDHYRHLITNQPEDSVPDLALSLSNLSVRLGDLGRLEEALKAAEEATGLYRGLAEPRPAAFTPDLARSLNNLADRLGELGRREEALQAAEESVRLQQSLAEVRPEESVPDLALSLSNLSVRLGDLGRLEEALKAAEEAIGLYRGLAEARPAAFTSDLVRSLNNLSDRLADLGQMEEALEAAEDAVGLYRGLAEAKPEDSGPELARSLSSLSSRLADLGRPEEALAAIEEAAGLYRGLAEARPAAFTSDLAWSLSSLSVRLGDLGRPEEALAAIEEAAGLYRGLA
ncbi:tetratricopeptide repeat protein, partial [Arthrobacter sp. SAFR-044]|uniref:tetratricopeptide repeat protein n=1 Tax=Arthrobacter sp. SAFR-044 TaxID=3387278 RepID=UPI003F7C9F4A